MIEEALNVVLVGHVDHGKSTLVGRLLHVTNSIEEGKFKKAKSRCKARGISFEWAFLVDAFKAELDQNITIDAGRVRLEFNHKCYTLIDAPGHEKFLSNMVTGAGSADFAILMIAADEGVQQQTRRHGYILEMLNIDQVAVVVNKMDLVDYSASRFNEIVADYNEVLGKIGLKREVFIPTSARLGKNVATAAEELEWYDGPTVLQALDAFTVVSRRDEAPLRFPIQACYDFDGDRVLAGRIEAGSLAVGDELQFTPDLSTACVRSIERWNAPSRVSASAGESIAILLDEEVPVDRGHVASHPMSPPNEAQAFRASLFWMGTESLAVGKTYKLQLVTQEVPCQIDHIERVIDCSKAQLVEKKRDFLEGYEIGEVVIKTERPIAIDSHGASPVLGRFVIVDDHDVSGGGIVRAILNGYREDISWQDGEIERSDRESLHGHRGACVWLTGLSGSGKSSVAIALEAELHRRGISTFILDGDNIRHGLSVDLGFSKVDRIEHIRRVGEVSNLFVDAGVLVISAFISPYQKLRDRVRELLGDDRFIEVHIDASLETCERRDPKGLYKRARAGEIKNFTGLSAPYEIPRSPESVINTVEDSNPQVSARRVVEYLETHGYLKA